MVIVHRLAIETDEVKRRDFMLNEKTFVTSGEFFAELLDSLQPPAERLEAAQKIPGNVREFLKTRSDFKTIFPYSHLVGSYARHTSVGDIKDVDILVYYDGTLQEKPRDVINCLRNTLSEFPEFIKGIGRAEVSSSRRSVHVYFESKDFHLDVVPAICTDGTENPIFVPDREDGTWIKSHPYGYVEFFSHFNERHHDKVRPLVRLIKHWRDMNMEIMKPKSYWLEAVVIALFQEKKLNSRDSLAVLFANLLSAIRERFQAYLAETSVPPIPDPMLGNNIAPNWERSHFETFMRRVDESANKAALALRAQTSEQARLIWQDVFVTAPSRKSWNSQPFKQIAQILPGTGFVNTLGRISDTRPASMPSVLSKPTRFHGE